MHIHLRACSHLLHLLSDEKNPVRSLIKKKHYYKKEKMLENDQNKDPLPSTSTAPLIFQLPSIKKHNFRKTYRRSLMKAYRSNKELLHKMSTLEKKNKTLQKRIERLKKNNKLSI